MALRFRTSPLMSVEPFLASNGDRSRAADETSDNEMVSVGEQDPEMAAIDDPGSAEMVPGNVERTDGKGS